MGVVKDSTCLGNLVQGIDSGVSGRTDNQVTDQATRMGLPWIRGGTRGKTEEGVHQFIIQ